MTPIERNSPNQSARVAAIDAVVIHDTGARTVAGTLDWIGRSESGVSYHYVVDTNGDVYRCVEESRKAWHAGKSTLHGRAGVNDFSVGVALVDADDRTPYSQPQLEAAAALVAGIVRRHPGIALNRIVGHCHVAPGRKVDPGPDFPWRAFLARVAALVAEENT